MKGELTASQREYVFYHLQNHFQLTDELRTKIKFISSFEEVEQFSNCIFFISSSKELKIESVREVDSIPVLFPVSNKNQSYFFDLRGNLIFCYDVFKSIFYLLSGFQEYVNTQSRDNLNRFDFQDSIQYKLNFTETPIVNYYFEKICEGVSRFCQNQKLPFHKQRLFDQLGFLLSHDVDRIDLYTRNYLLYKIKEILGLVPTQLSFIKNTQVVWKTLMQYIGLQAKENPYWNFDFLRMVERQFDFRSTFYFLDQGIQHSDADYSFGEKRLLELFDFIKTEKCEIGIHGSVETITDQEKMERSIAYLTKCCGSEIVGNRQHRLLWKHPATALIHQSVGLKYDTTLGFAWHEGFRNSYCYPFKLFDFKNDRMINVWQFPLMVMDGTLLFYRKYSNYEALEKCRHLIKEVKSFGGIFTLLWHNSFFDETTYPGINNLYLDILSEVRNQGATSLTGIELLNLLESKKNE